MRGSYDIPQDNTGFNRAESVKEKDDCNPTIMSRRVSRQEVPEEVMDSKKVQVSTEPQRPQWGNRFEFILSTIGFAIGLGNVWRFPYVVFMNGGGTFLVPYLIMLFGAGLPLFFLELSLGQYCGQGPTKIFGNLAPAFKGLGFAMLSICFLIYLYYNVILAWTLFYMFIGMQSKLPWTECNNSSSQYCINGNLTAGNGFGTSTEDNGFHYNMDNYRNITENYLNNHNFSQRVEDILKTVQCYNRIIDVDLNEANTLFIETVGKLNSSHCKNESDAIEVMKTFWQRIENFTKNFISKPCFENKIRPKFYNFSYGFAENFTSYYCNETKIAIPPKRDVQSAGHSVGPAEDFFNYHLLGIDKAKHNWSNFGELKWQLVLCLLAAWTIVCLCLIKGVQSAGKVVYFTGK